jgi:hypothetical protein
MFQGKGYFFVDWLVSSDFTGKRYCTCFKKYFARPGRRFLNSKMLTPLDNWPTHPASLPFPFPILDPETFFDKGKCGNKLNQIFLHVLSERLTDFFKNILYLKICFPVTHKGCNVRKA